MEKGRYVLGAILVTALLAGCITGCGEKNVSAGRENASEEDTVRQEAEPVSGEPENVQAPNESGKQKPIQDHGEESEKQESVQEKEDDIPGEDGVHYDFGPVSYDLTNLPPMENKLYAEWEGRIYYRQYSDEDISDGGLWAEFAPIANTEKELMYIEPDGKVVQVGVDYGYGTMFIVNGRIYSQKYLDLETYAESYRVYSCKLDGSDVAEYDSVMVLDAKNNGIICQTADNALAFIDAQTGRERILTDDSAHYLNATEEEIYYYHYLQNDKEEEYDVALSAVDYEGNINELTTVTRGEYADCMGEDYISSLMFQTQIEVPCFKMIRDDLYFSAGTYNGNAHMYTGGPIYSMKKDGSGCKVEAVAIDCDFYLYDDGADRMLYFESFDEEYGTSAGTEGMRQITLSGETQRELVLPRPYIPYEKPYVDDTVNCVRLYPDTSGICYILISTEECGELSIMPYVDGSRRQAVEDIEYLEGRLFFTVTDLAYNRDKCIGWRDYYDRGTSACYCKDLESGEITKLYEY